MPPQRQTPVKVVLEEMLYIVAHSSIMHFSFSHWPILQEVALQPSFLCVIFEDIQGTKSRKPVVCVGGFT